MLERRRVASGSSGNVIVVSGLHRLQSGRFCVTFLLLKFLTSHLSVFDSNRDYMQNCRAS